MVSPKRVGEEVDDYECEHGAGGEPERDRQQWLDLLDSRNAITAPTGCGMLVATAAQNWRMGENPAAAIGIATLVPSGMFCTFRPPPPRASAL
jgi:hypothetical protein